jgi:hypothetical protein
MQSQEIINEDGKDYLVIAVPSIPELFSYGFVSNSGKSFVFRKYSADKSILQTYQHVKFKPDLIKGRVINSHNHFHKLSFVTHYFNGIGLPCVKISVSKKLNHDTH